MTDAVAISLIGAVGTFAVSVVNAIMGIFSAQRGKRTEGHLRMLKEQTNGIQESLLKKTGESEFARGLKEGSEQK